MSSGSPIIKPVTVTPIRMAGTAPQTVTIPVSPYVPSNVTVTQTKDKKVPTWVKVIGIIILIIIIIIIICLIFFRGRDDKKLGESCDDTCRCTSGLTCDKGTCKSKIGGTCSSVSDCVSGASSCQNGICVQTSKGGLNSTCDNKTKLCGDGLTCQNNVCKANVGQTCMTVSDCVSGATACKNGTCINTSGGLNERCPCREGYVCDGSTDFCRVPDGGTCSSSSDCLTGSSCHHGKCLKNNNSGGGGSVHNFQWEKGFSGSGGVALNIEKGDTVVLSSADGNSHVVSLTKSNWNVKRTISNTFVDADKLALPELSDISSDTFIMDTATSDNSQSMRLHIVVNRRSRSSSVSSNSSSSSSSSNSSSSSSSSHNVGYYYKGNLSEPATYDADNVDRESSQKEEIDVLKSITKSSSKRSKGSKRSSKRSSSKRSSKKSTKGSKIIDGDGKILFNFRQYKIMGIIGAHGKKVMLSSGNYILISSNDNIDLRMSNLDIESMVYIGQENGILVGLFNGSIYKSAIDGPNIMWEKLNAIENITHISSTRDGSNLWLQANDTGYLYTFNQETGEFEQDETVNLDSGVIRRYGLDKDTFIDITKSNNTALLQPGNRKVSNISDGIVRDDKSLLKISTNDKTIMGFNHISGVDHLII